MDRRDERTLGLACRARRAQIAQSSPNPLAQLGGRLLGERDGQDRADVDVVLEHGEHEPLHQH